jgi:excinuclease UvrABC nuclease subunit
MNDKVNWLNHEFTVFNPDAAWNEVGGVYIFCGSVKNQWQPFYIGKTDNFRTRFSSHEVWDKAAKLGATHIHAMTIPTDAARDKVEQELIKTWKPPLNIQHV